MERCYSELISLPTYLDRYRYLKLDGVIGETTFGFERYLNQVFYNSGEWRRLRNEIIIRDLGCDLGIEGRDIQKGAIIHHINPITIKDIQNRNPCLFDPENLITTTDRTHKAIHYGDEKILIFDPIERTPYDTCPWRH